MMELHRGVMRAVTAMRTFAAQIGDRFFLFLDPAILAVIIEAVFAQRIEPPATAFGVKIVIWFGLIARTARFHKKPL